ncbi:MAG: SUKH-4 family immunity protein [Planctomycetes bacterium]|nr:SUKH-4 family immunity protein [Planctomycetota bacterium]
MGREHVARFWGDRLRRVGTVEVGTWDLPGASKDWLMRVGIPIPETRSLWNFRFSGPEVPEDGREPSLPATVVLGASRSQWVGAREPTGEIVVTDRETRQEEYANASVEGFIEFLTAYAEYADEVERCTTTVAQRQTFRSFKERLRGIDPSAFERRTHFWPAFLAP